MFDFGDVILDLSHEKINENTLKMFQELANKANLKKRFEDMFEGAHINVTENRSVLHTALRAPITAPGLIVD